MTLNIKKWREDLPTDCPPDDAILPNCEIFYRLTEKNVVQESDFDSQRIKYPGTEFKTGECIARAVSIYNNLSGIEIVHKLPRHKNKFIIRLLLNDDAGVIKKTFKGGHNSWWIKKDFNPISAILNDEKIS